MPCKSRPRHVALGLLVVLCVLLTGERLVASPGPGGGPKRATASAKKLASAKAPSTLAQGAKPPSSLKNRSQATRPRNPFKQVRVATTKLRGTLRHAGLKLHATLNRLRDPPLRLSRKSREWRRVLDKHSAQRVRYGHKSRFRSGEDIAALIRGAKGRSYSVQKGGNVVRTYDAGRVIGFDKRTMAPTPLVTVITKPSGELVTAHPGPASKK